MKTDSRRPILAKQIIFSAVIALWLLAVNLLYLAQFRDLAASVGQYLAGRIK